MFTKSEQLYDAIYGWKDYKAEASRLAEIIGSHKRSSGNDLLDVACGTGGHIPHLGEAFRIEGLDWSADVPPVLPYMIEALLADWAVTE